MSLLKLVYNPESKNAMKSRDPFTVEGDGDYILCTFNTDRTSKQIPEKIDLPLGWVYCHYTNNNALMIGLLPTAWKTLFNHFTKKEVNGKWVDDLDKLKVVDELGEVFEENKGRMIIYCDPHPGVAEFVKFYHGQWVNVQTSVLTKDTDKIIRALKAYETEDEDDEIFAECFMGEDWECDTSYTIIPCKRGRRSVPLLVHPETREPLTRQEEKDGVKAVPLISLIGDLPVVRGGGKKRKTVGERYSENLAVILQETGCKDFDSVLELAFNDPVRLQLHYANIGITLSLTQELNEQSIKQYWDEKAKQNTASNEEE